MGDSVRVTLQQHAKIDVARIPELLQKYRDELKFQMESLAFGLHAAAEKFKGKDRSAGEEPCTGGRSAADHTGVKYSHNHKIV